jgi:hypothetical protein
MEYIFWWVLFAVPCFFINFCNGAVLSHRLVKRYVNISLFENFKKYIAKGFLLFVHDHFGVHCPWSWKRAKKYRLADTRILLGKEGRFHSLLGHITAEDCDIFSKQEEIVRHVYVTRIYYWSKSILYFLFAPIHVIITFLFPGNPKKV